MSGKSFIRVVPEEVGQHGADGAIVLAHIRYRCETDGPGRFVVDGVRWWQVSLAELATELCISRDVVKRTVKRLGKAIAANNFEPDKGRTLAYHVPPRSDALTCERAESPQPDLRKGESTPPVGRNRPTLGADSPFTHLSGELGEGGGEGGRAGARPAPAQADAASANGKPPSWRLGPHGPRCRRHVNDPDPPGCRGCEKAREADKAERDAEQARQDEDRARIRRAIDSCRDCDQYGRLDDLRTCPKHPSFREAS
ncbi:hypothetical protein HMPREF0591_4861 [Mycobacterium parascrofulaceum ATCC BAA-614]|uniref:Uncharacterized protein n=1 Tax=Mycobacterium parascrofulaceum ATCC BAA-614 TaxID=525368 RepID=D5PFB3_9MYCO|nr:hypothetical protein HMPREF0591_4861 [Mycobacterium parascrofulaceum ATCC BAA-614]